ncbi:cysteine proteinase RD21A-like [Nicotiana tabacum]|uniref:Cysteine proteinase RD21A-like n=1 Tax=Nicotiana tabacum TaxID=4097 RepID=A0AC58TKV3_TOBAC
MAELLGFLNSGCSRRHKPDRTGEMITLSEQELVDCDRIYNDGCDGGLMDYAFEFIISNDGIDTDTHYPYKGIDYTCDLVRKNAKVVSIDGYEDVPANEKSLQKAVAHQPVSVAIDASSRAFQLYSSPPFSSSFSSFLFFFFLLLLEKGVDYWIVRNSWDTNWGEDGYIKMERNVKDTNSGKCGIAMEASYPIKNAKNKNTVGEEDNIGSVSSD